jgi:hypothetical protein
MVHAYNYEEQYVVCVKEDKESCIRMARKLSRKYKKKYKKEPGMRPYCFNVLEVETDKLYFPAYESSSNMTPQVWDEHDEIVN